MTRLPLSSDAAMAFGLASTALPFAESPADEVERWLRPLRLYGESAAVLNGLAIGEAPLTAGNGHLSQSTEGPPGDVVSAVARRASDFAAQRGMPAVCTLDLLVAVMREYPEAFEQALKNRGSDTAELTDRLAQRLHMALR